MALFGIPRELQELLLEFEFHGKSYGNPIQSRHNIVLDDIAIETFQQQKYMLGIPQMVEGATRDMINATVFPLGPDVPLGDNRDMVWMQQFHSDMPSTGKVLLFNVRDGMEVVQQQQCQWICDHETIVLPLEDRNIKQLRIFETYAGGYGGWASAFRFLKTRFDIPCQLVGIEEDFTMAKQYCMNHGATMIDGRSEVYPNMFVVNNDDFLIHGDIRSKRWWQSIAHWAPHVMTISSPCPPWTGAAHSQGLRSPLGMLLAETLILLRIFRPQVVAIEQVHAFATHEDKKHCIAILKSAGYVITYSQVVDSACFGASTRLRWLCLAIRKNATGLSIRPFHMWPSNHAKTPDQIGAIVESFHSDSRLKIDHDTWTRAMDKRLLPLHDRPKHVNSSPQQVLESRCYDASSQHPTFMAQYGQQQRLGYYYLCDKGLLAHFLKVDGLTPRHLHPLEIAMMHISWDKMWIPNDLSISWKMIGNCITLPHALLLVSNLIAMFDELQEGPDVDTIFRAVYQQRLTSRNVEKVSHDIGTMFFDAQLSVHENINQNIDAFLELQASDTTHSLPKHSAWNPQKGLFDVQQLIQAGTEHDTAMIPPSAVTLTEQSPCVSQTQEFVPMLKAQVQVAGKVGDVWVSGSVSPSQVVRLFDGMFVIQTSDNSDDPYQIILSKADVIQNDDDSGSPDALILIQNHQMNVLAMKPNEPVLEQMISLGIDDNIQDLWGQLTTETCSHDGVFLIDTKIDGVMTGDIWFLLAAIKQTETLIQWNIDTWHWVIKIEGQETARHCLGDFWINLLCEETKAGLGIVAHQVIQESTVIVHFSIEDPFIPLPKKHFAMMLVSAASKAILRSQIDDVQGIETRIKWADRIIWEGKCDRCAQVDVLASLLGYVFHPILSGLEVRIVVGGRTYYNISLGSLADTLQKQSLTLHLVVTLHGGGGAKDNQRVSIKNSVATTLLEQGHDIAWVSKAVDTLLQKAGTKRISQLAQLPVGKNRIDQTHKLLQECEVEYPSKNATSPQKIAATTAGVKQRRKSVMQPCAQHYTIEKGFLLNGDDSNCEQVSEIRPGQSGVVLVDHDKAIPWLREDTLLSPDEFAMLIIGKHDAGPKLKSTLINVPCTDVASRPTILLCTMVQLGQKPVKMKKYDSQNVMHEDCQVVSFTMWKSDFGQKDWECIVDQTPTFIRKVLAKEDMTASLIAIWGKALRNHKSPTTAEHATSVQMHATIKQSMLSQLLEISGFNKVYVTPKDEQGRISQKWRVIWCEGDVAHMQTLAAATTACQGLIRANNKLGLRFERSSFAAA